ncbi:MAG: hypothetical protein ACLTDR_02905 [Adlercreutzia equolifaciens]
MRASRWTIRAASRSALWRPGCARCREKAADAIHEKGGYDNGTRGLLYYAMLREVRRSLGYDGADAKVGSRFSTLRGRARLLWQRTEAADGGKRPGRTRLLRHLPVRHRT